MAAFARLAENPPAADQLPNWPRSVRLAIDYSLRVALDGAADMKEAELDSFARTCMTLGALQARDPPGDPATGAACEIAANAGSEYEHDFALLGQLRDGGIA